MSSKILFLIFGMLILGSLADGLASQLKLKKQFYKECEFDYENPDEDWPLLDCKQTCDKNQYFLQSPVAVKSEKYNPVLKPLEFSYPEFDYNGTLFNNGHTVVVHVQNYSGVGRYKLEQIHFHTSAEHLLFGERELHDIEVHLIHYDEFVDRRLVVAIFGDVDDGVVQGQSSWINTLAETIVKIPNVNDEISITLSGLASTFQHLKDNKLDGYWTFPGSLTTPPCTEVVQWYLMKTPLNVNAETHNKIQGILTHNHRPIQRELEDVSFYDPKYREPNVGFALLFTLLITIVILGVPFGFFYWKYTKTQRYEEVTL